MPEYRITGYVPGARSAIAHFQRPLWKGGPRRNAAYLDWKYVQNPYLDGRYIALAWEGERLIGMAGAFGACWEANGGERLMLPCLSDTLVARERQGSAVFHAMLDEIVGRVRGDGIPWLLDFGDQGAAPSMLMRGWKSIGPWPFATLKREHRPAWRRALARPAGEGIRGTRSGVLIRADLTGCPPSSWEAMAALAARLPPQGGVHHVRDTRYLAWRYRNPLARHYYFAAGDSELEGHLVAHRTRVDRLDGPTPTTIIECESVSDEVWMDLVEAASGLVPGSVVLMWARDIATARLAGLEAVGYEMDAPTGRLSRDWHLPNLYVRSTGVSPGSPRFAGLDAPSAWDLRAVCGRCWR